MNKPCLAEERKQFLVAQDVRDAGVDAPFDLIGQATVDQFLTELDKLLAVDAGFLVGQDEKADLMFVYQLLDLVHDFDRIAHPVVAPEFPLRTE